MGGTRRQGETVLTGAFEQTSFRRLVVETDHAAGPTDLLSVRGRASLGDTVEVRPVHLADCAVTVLRATDGLTLNSDLATSARRCSATSRVPSATASSSSRAPTSAPPPGSEPTSAVVATLQRIWGGGSTFGGFTALPGLNDDGGYGCTLHSLSGWTVGAISASRNNSSHNFITNMLNDCTTFRARAGRWTR